MKSIPPGPVPNDTRALPLHDAISAQARTLWEKYGRPEGRDLAIWLEAQNQVLGVDPAVNQQPGGGAVSAPALREAATPRVPKKPAPAAAVPPAAKNATPSARRGSARAAAPTRPAP